MLLFLKFEYTRYIPKPLGNSVLFRHDGVFKKPGHRLIVGNGFIPKDINDDVSGRTPDHIFRPEPDIARYAYNYIYREKLPSVYSYQGRMRTK
jgi:hypothetical protein